MKERVALDRRVCRIKDQNVVTHWYFSQTSERAEQLPDVRFSSYSASFATERSAPILHPQRAPGPGSRGGPCSTQSRHGGSRGPSASWLLGGRLVDRVTGSAERHCHGPDRAAWRGGAADSRCDGPAHCAPGARSA